MWCEVFTEQKFLLALLNLVDIAVKGKPLFVKKVTCVCRFSLVNFRLWLLYLNALIGFITVKRTSSLMTEHKLNILICSQLPDHEVDITKFQYKMSFEYLS